MNVLLIAEDAAGVRTLQAFQRSNHRIVAVMSSPSQQNVAQASLWSTAAKLGYITWPVELVKDRGFADQVRENRVDMILNVHSLFRICKEVLQAPLLGSFNLHPGPLPRYAGLNSVCWAIYRGEKTHGVSLHRMESGIDTGSIVIQKMFDINTDETGLSLTSKCVNIGVPLLFQLLEIAERDPTGIPATQQDLTKREYFGREVPENGYLSWNRPAQDVFNFVRSCDFAPFYSPWGHPRTMLGNCKLGVARCRLTGKRTSARPGTVGESQNMGVEVACADEWIMVNRVLKGGEYLLAGTLLRAGDQLQIC